MRTARFFQSKMLLAKSILILQTVFAVAIPGPRAPVAARGASPVPIRVAEVAISKPVSTIQSPLNLNQQILKTPDFISSAVVSSAAKHLPRPLSPQPSSQIQRIAASQRGASKLTLQVQKPITDPVIAMSSEFSFTDKITGEKKQLPGTTPRMYQAVTIPEIDTSMPVIPPARVIPGAMSKAQIKSNTGTASATPDYLLFPERKITNPAADAGLSPLKPDVTPPISRSSSNEVQARAFEKQRLELLNQHLPPGWFNMKSANSAPKTKQDYLDFAERERKDMLNRHAPPGWFN